MGLASKLDHVAFNLAKLRSENLQGIQITKNLGGDFSNGYVTVLERNFIF